MKPDKSKHGRDGELKNGVFEEYFKDGTLAYVGEYVDGEKNRRVEILLAQWIAEDNRGIFEWEVNRRVEMVMRPLASPATA